MLRWLARGIVGEAGRAVNGRFSKMDPLTFLLVIAALAGAVAVGVLVERRRSAPIAAPSTPAEHEPPEQPTAPAAPTSEPPTAPIYQLATELEEFYQASAHPRDLLTSDVFQRAATLFDSPHFPSPQLLEYMVGSSVTVACMALEATRQRNDDFDVTAFILENFTEVHLWTTYFALRTLGERARRPVVGDVLVRARTEWPPLGIAYLKEFVAARLTRGEVPTFADLLTPLDAERRREVAGLVDRIGSVIPQALRDELRVGPTSSMDTTLLRAVGRLWDAAELEAQVIVENDGLDAAVDDLERAVRTTPSRPVALVGESGVGKTTLVRALARRLVADGWVVFEAGAADLMAGMMYIGQAEERLKSLFAAIEGKPVLWVVPAMQELLWAGAYRERPSGMLDTMLPYIERGAIVLIGELRPAAYEQLVRARPQLRNFFVRCVIQAPNETGARALVSEWARKTGVAITEDVLREAAQLALQYLGDRASPGSLVQFLETTWRRIVPPGATPRSITLDDLLVTLAQLTGLPLGMLDERQGLDLEGLRAFFRRKVIGQNEAVESLVERVAMIKAGVSDPRRPLGVFLFVGPTGTGKTEIAKTLATYLFGSPDRMIRLDMSELQTPEALGRIVGSRETPNAGESTALTSAIRQQPFSVVLLDEFEKAHPNIWDLFLQVFDDGRLSDARGGVADFRHAVIIMTSNLGATLPHGAGIGFTGGSAGFSRTLVDKAVGETFRREFVNRIDRVVVFQPLARADMRQILRKELDDVLTRRGFRNRSWAVEWEASAIDFLLEKGFTPDMGARPLRRAIERYLLAPLATTIVAHEVPAGDQFLFVRRHAEKEDRLEVVFVDPDAPDDEPESRVRTADERAAKVDLRSLVFDAYGSDDEIDYLEDRYESLSAIVGVPDWEARKAAALASTREPGFWDSPLRFGVLGLAEYMDRIEAAFETAGSLLLRLSHPTRDQHRNQPRDLVRRLAQQIYVLDAACSALAANEPRDAFLLVRGVRDSGVDPAAVDRFAQRVADMYREWARQRRMRLDVLEEKVGSSDAGYSALFTVSGLGAYAILRAESGLHVYETPQDEKSFVRARARVIVAPQPDEPAATPKEARAQGYRAIDALRDDGTAQLIVRRYREDPSPLVRDTVRQWRTGRIDRVLAGDFDVMQ
jgi:ATP-dependent Clp protease ATP-binding subunit ClpC